MIALLPDPPMLLAFVGASLALSLTPGPGVLFIVARSAMQGRRSALASVAGIALGNFANALMAAIGLATLFKVTPWAYEAIRWAGAAYLVWIGIRAIRRARLATAAVQLERDSAAKVLRDGFFVALLNPKTTLFFAAFLPQFIPHANVAPAEIIALGSIFVVVAAGTDSLYALASTMLTRSVTTAERLASTGGKITGSILIGLGLFAMLTGANRV